MTKDHSTIYASEISHWMDCPRRALYSRLVRQEKKQSTEKIERGVAALLGIFVHEALCMKNNGDGWDLIIKEIKSHYTQVTSDGWVKFNKLIPNADALHNEVIRMTRVITEFKDLSSYQQEMPLEAEWNGEVRLKGRADYILYTKSKHSVEIIDIKTGLHPYAAEQMACYALAAKNIYNIDYDNIKIGILRLNIGDDKPTLTYLPTNEIVLYIRDVLRTLTFRVGDWIESTSTVAEFHAKHGRKLPPMNSASKSCSSCKLNGTWSCPVTKLIDPADALQEAAESEAVKLWNEV